MRNHQRPVTGAATLVCLVVVSVFSSIGHSVSAQDHVDDQFEVVLALLPESERANATLIDVGIDGDAVLRQASGSFVCRREIRSGERVSVLCYHESLGAFLAHQRGLSAEGLRGESFRVRLCADVDSGLVEVPSRAYMVDATATVTSTGAWPDSVLVYHFLQLPDATEKEVGLTAEELAPGTPWLHHAGTCDAHVMWSEMQSARR